MNEHNDETFKMGFLGAAKWYLWGLTVEDILLQAKHMHTVEYCAGAQAFADKYLGRTSTPYARRANKLGLIVETNSVGVPVKGGG